MNDSTYISDAFDELETSCVDGDIEMVRKLLADGANPSSDHDCNTALPEAVKNGHIEIVRLLLKNGADPNRVHPILERKPLSVAIDYRNRLIAQVLLEHGAELNDQMIIHLFTYGECESKVPFAIAIGIDLNRPLGHYERTPMHIVSVVDDPFSVHAMKAEGAEMNIRDNNGDLPIDIAKRNNYLELVELLSSK